MPQKLVSIIMPAYMAEQTIGEAIQSVLAQSCAHWELLIIDDASSDATGSIAGAFAKKDTRIRYIRLDKNGGPAAARNAGLALASGFFIAFLDADDVWLNNKLLHQIEAWEETKAEIIYAGYGFMRPSGKLDARIEPSCTTYKSMLKENIIHWSTSFFTREAIGNVIFDTRFKNEDYVFLLNLLRNPKLKTYGLQHVLTHVRLGGRNSDKLAAAKCRWLIYRQSEGLSFLQSVFYFACYAFTGIRKYYFR